MLLYDDTHAPNPRRVRIFIAEKGIEVPLRQVSIIKGEHRQPDYRKIASNARLPALELDDGTVILETVAICRYFEGEQPSPPLFGKDGKEQALVEMWQRRMELELFMPLALAFRHTHPAMATLENQFKDFGEAQLKYSKKSLQMLEQCLATSPYVAGEQYSIADITAQCALDFFLRFLNEDVPDSHKATIAWREGLAARPSSQA